MLEKDINDKRLARHKDSQEDFTPKSVINEMFSLADKELFTDFDKTYLDTSAGTGNLICAVLEERLKYAKKDKDILHALSTLYGIELYEDNLNECHCNIIKTLTHKSPHIYEKYKNTIDILLQKHIVRGDFINDDINKLFT